MWENGFTLENIANTANKGTLARLPGRNLIERANKVIANYKLAFKFQKEFANSERLESSPSGHKLEDMLICVRKKMRLKLLGAKDGSGASKKAAATFKEKSEDDMPANCFFVGHVAFILFGPQGVCAKRLGCLSEDGKGIDLPGRKKGRIEEAKQKKKERDAGARAHAPACHVRGVGVQEKASETQLAQFEASKKTCNTVMPPGCSFPF